MRTVLNELRETNRANWTWDSLAELLITSLRGHQYRNALADLRKEERAWRQACQEAEEVGDTRPYFKRRVNEEYVLGSFRDNLLFSLMQTFESSNNPAGQFGSRDILGEPPSIPPKILDPSVWIQPWLVNDGAPTDGVLEGERGTGKTDFAIHLADLANKAGRFVLTNVPVSEARDPAEPADEACVYNAYSVRDMVVVLSNIYRNTPERRVLYIMDEAAAIKATKNRDKVTKEGKAMHDFMMVARKFGVDFLWIVQDQASLASELRHMADVHIKKVNRTTAEITTNGNRWPDLYLSKMRVKGLKKTSLTFGTRDFAPFSMEGSEEVKGLCRMHKNVLKAIDAAMSHFGGVGGHSSSYCELCDKTFKSPKGLNLHHHKVHGARRVLGAKT